MIAEEHALGRQLSAKGAGILAKDQRPYTNDAQVLCHYPNEN
jgi:hypothetical protein